jgi:acyl-CoA synthetase (AMP-forming)/AMP-acid ligase II
MAPLHHVRPDTATVPFARGLAAHGDRTAVITRDGALSYRDLAARVDAAARRLGSERRLVLLAGANEIESIVFYLAALAAGTPVLLAPGDNPASLESLVAAYDPDVVVSAVGGDWLLDERRAVSAHALHPDLALLLSTSGSTGSPKLVRLSHGNVQANAESIADYLGIRSTDRAATTLPMHYCYGLSVINSHLLRGAALILTDLSVVDTCFWDLFRDSRGTTFAGVPYTFDLLDRVGFAEMRLPHLRYVTQAGGRLAPDRVRRYAELGQRNGWDLYVMYGQTEATARMAYLPPDLAACHPHTIGIPIPGGSFSIEPLPDCDDPDTGELVYAGPNVMLGYAETRSDLRLGRTVDTLHTGDIARRTSDGLYELVGRQSRFAKVFGLRIDLQRIEATLDNHGVTACCVDDDDELVVAVEGGADADRVQRLAARECGLPARAVRVFLLTELPRLATGKPDYRAIRELARASGQATHAAGSPQPAAATDLRDLFAEILDRPDATDDSTFVSLGGDSLSYVEMSVRLEQALGHLPSGWHTTPIRDLRPAARPPAKRWHALDMSVALRAIAIVLIVGSHSRFFAIPGGAHLLLGVAGFNFARFHLAGAGRHERVRHMLASVARIAVPSMAWIAVLFALTDDYGLANVFLLNNLLGPDKGGGPKWHFWFVEAVLYILLALLAALSIPLIDRVERRFPFGFPMALVALGLTTRFEILSLHTVVHISRPHVVFWLFALGWAAAKAATAWQRLCVTAAIAATVPGFFGEPGREAVVIGGMILLVWVASIRTPGPVNRMAAVLASSSLYIYLTHWQIYPHLNRHHSLLALLASLGAGIAYSTVVTYAMARLSALRLRAPTASRPTEAP